MNETRRLPFTRPSVDPRTLRVSTLQRRFAEDAFVEHLDAKMYSLPDAQHQCDACGFFPLDCCHIAGATLCRACFDKIPAATE